MTNIKQKIEFETHPSRYNHWQLEISDRIAFLHLNVKEDRGLREDYRLKLNSYDLGVDIELADAVERIRFEHPNVAAVVIDSALDRMFCAGANIYMLGTSTHAFKVNFCKFTNETRLAIEDASANSNIKFIAAVNGICAGGGYELALACDDIVLIDDGSSAVSLPEVPLLGVLPGTGGLTRLVDKRKVRRDLADYFSTMSEGVRGKRALDWGFVDAIIPRSQFKEKILQRAKESTEEFASKEKRQGVVLTPIKVERKENEWVYDDINVAIDRQKRIATITICTPHEIKLEHIEDIESAGEKFWPLAFFRQFNDALLHLRFNELEIGTWVLKSEGEGMVVSKYDQLLLEHREHWFVNEVLHYIKRTLKRLDLSARSLIALIEPGSCFYGTFLEIALAADRQYMLDDPERASDIGITKTNGGVFPMSNGLSRLHTRFLSRPEYVEELVDKCETYPPADAEEAGLITFAPDDIDWEDEVRIAIEERASLSPDALTGLEANLRFAGPETLETKIFGRLSAWQNWIFQRPNAVGEKGALTLYGEASARPEFDWRRT